MAARLYGLGVSGPHIPPLYTLTHSHTHINTCTLLLHTDASMAARLYGLGMGPNLPPLHTPNPGGGPPPFQMGHAHAQGGVNSAGACVSLVFVTVCVYFRNECDQVAHVHTPHFSC